MVADVVSIHICMVTCCWRMHVCSLVCDASNRLGADVEELKAHPFFHNTDWDFIRDRPAAIPVHVKHMADTSNFDDFEELDEQKRCTCVPFYTAQSSRYRNCSSEHT